MIMDIINTLQMELSKLERICNNTAARLASAPEGALEISKGKRALQYRLKTSDADSKPTRRYLRADEMNIVQALAQKSYDMRLLHEAERQYNALAFFLKEYDPGILAKIYESLSPERKALVKGAILDDDTFVQRWKAVTYAPGEFSPTDPEFYALRGERVRSKSEKIIADTLLARETPYRYEPPLNIIKGQKPWRPDFLVLNKRTRKEYIWEHLGKMDDEDYCKKSIRKLETYLQQGYFIGETLLITMETSEHPLSTRIVDSIIDKYLK